MELGRHPIINRLGGRNGGSEIRRRRWTKVVRTIELILRQQRSRTALRVYFFAQIAQIVHRSRQPFHGLTAPSNAIRILSTHIIGLFKTSSQMLHFWAREPPSRKGAVPAKNDMSKHIESVIVIPCQMPKHKLFGNLSGSVFGRLTVLKLAGHHPKRTGAYYWECRCECGVIKIISSQGLRSKTSQSCGCLHRDRARERARRTFKKHGQSDTACHKIWLAMRNRCRNPKCDAWERYGRRGIKVCERWNDFARFLADMGARPSPQHTVERRDNSGDYEPSNCYWATPTQQGRNKRNNVNITFNGTTMCASAWNEHLGFPPGMVYQRLYIGWTVERALTQPPMRQKS